MTLFRHAGAALALSVSLAAVAAAAHDAPQSTPRASKPLETVTLKDKAALPNIPGKTFATLVVSYPPGGKSAAHRHGQAFVYAYVLSGAIRSRVVGEPAKVYRAGESWIEKPGARHAVSENASATAPASLLAVFVADDGATLVSPDHR